MQRAAHLMAIIPDTFVSAFANGELLQVLLLAALTGFAINALPDRLREPISHVIDAAAAVFFGIVAIVVKAAPVGAFGATAFTTGAYGFGSLVLLGELDPVKLHQARGGKPIAGVGPQPGSVVPLPEPVANRSG